MLRCGISIRGGHRRSNLGLPDALVGVDIIAWLSADGPVEHASGLVSSWSTRAGSGGPFTQNVDANKPAWVDAAYNGRPTIRGHDANDVLTTASSISLGTSVSLFLALKRSTIASSYEISDTTGGNSSIISNFLGTTKIEWFNGADRYQLSSAVTGLHIYCVTQVNAGALKGYLDGSEVFSQTATVALTHLKYLFSLNKTNGSDGDIPELIAAAGVVSDAKRAAVTAYLGAKYGVAVT